jgi:hypothetical protein
MAFARYRKGEAIIGLDSTLTLVAEEVAGAVSMGDSNNR